MHFGLEHRIGDVITSELHKQSYCLEKAFNAFSFELLSILTRGSTCWSHHSSPHLSATFLRCPPAFGGGSSASSFGLAVYPRASG